MGYIRPLSAWRGFIFLFLRNEKNSDVRIGTCPKCLRANEFMAQVSEHLFPYVASKPKVSTEKA